MRDEAEARAVADTLGYPVLLKASLGGGGRGIRIVWDADSLATAVRTCQSEAAAAFGSSEIYLEKYVEGARHVEVQVLADGRGHTIHLGERDCSIQRRHQKLLEESPCPVLAHATRAGADRAPRSASAGRRATRARARWSSCSTGSGRFYFLEVNTRIQVEHPVTEMVTGIDLVRAQIQIAAGEPLGLRQEDVVFRGHAIECRVTAEDPVTFTPSPGRVTAYIPPGGPRRARGQPLLRGLHGPPVLRLAGREDHRPRRGPRGGAGPHAAGGGRVHRGGDQDHLAAPRAPSRRSAAHGRGLLHDVPRIRALTGRAGGDGAADADRPFSWPSSPASTAVARARPRAKVTIRIATQSPLTSEQAARGDEIRLGAQLALEQLGGPLERLGFRLELAAFDDQGRPDSPWPTRRTSWPTGRFWRSSAIWTRGSRIPASEIYKEVSLAMIAPAGTGTLLTDRASPASAASAGGTTSRARPRRSSRPPRSRSRACTSSTTRTTAGQDVAELFRAEAERRGLRILGFEGTDERAEFDPVIGPIKARSPDLVFFAGRPEQAGPFWRRAREQGVKARLLGSDGLDSPAFARLAGPAAVGAYYTSVGGPPASLPGGAAFRGDFRRRFGREPGLVAAGAYDAAAIALKAIEAATRGDASQPRGRRRRRSKDQAPGRHRRDRARRQGGPQEGGLLRVPGRRRGSGPLGGEPGGQAGDRRAATPELTVRSPAAAWPSASHPRCGGSGGRLRPRVALTPAGGP